MSEKELYEHGECVRDGTYYAMFEPTEHNCELCAKRTTCSSQKLMEERTCPDFERVFTCPFIGDVCMGWSCQIWNLCSRLSLWGIGGEMLPLPRIHAIMRAKGSTPEREEE